MIYAIGDLHLSDGDKPMDVFGPHWTGHFSRIETDWREKVNPEDIVLLPGDLSWAMQLDAAVPHLKLIGDLPGRKILIRGNHDYWWSSISRVREKILGGMYALQNDCVELDDVLFCGSRGWILPGPDCGSDDKKIYERERIRLEMSLSAARKRSATKPIVCMLHYPPCTQAVQKTGFTEILSRYAVSVCVYGHLHGPAFKTAFQGFVDGVFYMCASCDGLGFRLREVLLNGETDEQKLRLYVPGSQDTSSDADNWTEQAGQSEQADTPEDGMCTENGDTLLQ